MFDRRQCGNCSFVTRPAAAHDDRLQRGLATGGAADALSEIRFRRSGHRAAIEHSGIGRVRRRNDLAAGRFDHRANGFGVVLVRPAAEGAEIHPSPRAFLRAGRHVAAPAPTLARDTGADGGRTGRTM
jgi:hypothetical protein